VEKVINLKIVLWILSAAAFIVFIVNFCFCNSLSIGFIIDSLSKIVFIITVIVVPFSKYLWKLKIFQGWLVHIPNLNGTWTGYIESDYINKETGKAIDPIYTELTIKQSLLNISCTMETNEMKSKNTLSGFNIDKDSQTRQLIYVYLSEPNQKIQERSRIHRGTIIFDIDKENNKDIILKGNYWTGRKTSGTMILRKM
jgi:hypothetical protein